MPRLPVYGEAKTGRYQEAILLKKICPAEVLWSSPQKLAQPVLMTAFCQSIELSQNIWLTAFCRTTYKQHTTCCSRQNSKPESYSGVMYQYRRSSMTLYNRWLKYFTLQQTSKTFIESLNLQRKTSSSR